MYQQIAINIIHQHMQNTAPYLTGNLAYRGISDPTMLNVNAIGFTIGMNAHYGVLLNNEPVIKGYNNKHYKWIDKGIDRAVVYAANALGGRYTIERS